MRIILIGNYLPDRQESMERFSLMLVSGFRDSEIESEIWRPTPLFSKIAKSTLFGIGKWLGYIDKWLVFPFLLRWRIIIRGLNKPDVFFHVCDHSNAPYLKYLPTDRSGITCHDVLAIRGAMGHEDAYCPATRTGKILQKWIRYNLTHARKIICDSKMTLRQLYEITLKNDNEDKNWRVVPIGFNADFYPMKLEERTKLLSKLGFNNKEPFLLHVGSSLPRKNRKLLLDMVIALGDKWRGSICFAGQPIDNDLRAYADSLGLADRVISIAKPDHSTLVALYSACYAFVFPSFSEGFGWPVIEAQACGAPVIASSIEPMPEVSGGAALFADPTDPQGFADALLLLEKDNIKNRLIDRGFENCGRYDPAKMINAYLALYE